MGPVEPGPLERMEPVAYSRTDHRELAPFALMACILPVAEPSFARTWADIAQEPQAWAEAEPWDRAKDPSGAL